MRPCDLASGGRIIAAMSCSRHAPGYGGAAAGAPTLTGMTQSAPATGPADAERPLGTAVERDLSAAFGEVVRSTAAITTMGAGLKAMCQGEVTQNTEVLEDSRKHAIDRMIENARLLGANASSRRGSTPPAGSGSSPSWWPTGLRLPPVPLAVPMTRPASPHCARPLASQAGRQRLPGLLREQYARSARSPRLTPGRSTAPDRPRREQ